MLCAVLGFLPEGPHALAELGGAEVQHLMGLGPRWWRVDPERLAWYVEISAELKRYGVGIKDRGYAWAMGDERFDISKHPNEPNRCGYVVEYDPFEPDAAPKKSCGPRGRRRR